MIQAIYELLYEHYGSQGWWPGESRLEICISAILVQNTSWNNVERALHGLKVRNLLPREDSEEENLEYARRLLSLDEHVLSEIVRPAGFYRRKVLSIKEFLSTLLEFGGFSGLGSLGNLREVLLGIRGIGKETADSIMLYVFGKAYFPVSSYARRLFKRHALPFRKYEHVRRFVEVSLKHDVRKLKEMHALIVRVCKTYCRKSTAYCEFCVLKGAL